MPEPTPPTDQSLREAIARQVWRTVTEDQAGDHDDDGWESGGDRAGWPHAVADAVLGVVLERVTTTIEAECVEWCVRPGAEYPWSEREDEFALAVLAAVRGLGNTP
jgi:hypothetical protein